MIQATAAKALAIAAVEADLQTLMDTTLDTAITNAANNQKTNLTATIPVALRPFPDVIRK